MQPHNLAIQSLHNQLQIYQNYVMGPTIHSIYIQTGPSTTYMLVGLMVAKDALTNEQGWISGGGDFSCAPHPGPVMLGRNQGAMQSRYNAELAWLHIAVPLSIIIAFHCTGARPGCTALLQCFWRLTGNTAYSMHPNLEKGAAPMQRGGGGF